MTKPIDWPSGDGTWWYMRFRKSRRSKWRRLLVEFYSIGKHEWVTPFDDDSRVPKAFCTKHEATFLPAAAPPDEEDWDD